MGHPRKGQWFLIGGLILAILISYVAATKGQITVGQNTNLERDFAFDTMKSATRSVLSGIVAENTSKEYVEERLLDWEYILKTYSSERASNISGFILLGIPGEGYVNATILNFFQQGLENVYLSLGASSLSGFGINGENISTFYLSESSNYFPVNMTYRLDNQVESVAFNTTRKAFFVFKLRLSKRGGDEVMQDLVYG